MGVMIIITVCWASGQALIGTISFNPHSIPMRRNCHSHFTCEETECNEVK